GGLEIDHHDQLRRELHWQVTRRRAMQDFVHVCGGAATAPALIDAVADQPAGIDIFAISEDGWQPVRDRQRGYVPALAKSHCSLQDDDRDFERPRGVLDLLS